LGSGKPHPTRALSRPPPAASTRARRAPRKPPELPRLVARQVPRPPTGLAEQPGDLAPIVRRQLVPPGLEPEVDDGRAAAQLRPRDFAGAREAARLRHRCGG
jgi:hypothetical protein